MCKGLAVCVNEEGNVICKGLESHDETKGDLTGTEEDEYLDFEIILPDYDKAVWDRGDEGCIKIYTRNGLLNNENQPKEEIIEALNKWIKDNETKILKWFATNPELWSHQKVEGNMYCYGQEVKGNMDCSGQEVEGNMDCSGQKVKGDILIKNMVNGSNETQKLLDEFSESEQKNYSFDEFVKWLRRLK